MSFGASPAVGGVNGDDHPDLVVDTPDFRGDDGLVTLLPGGADGPSAEGSQEVHARTEGLPGTPNRAPWNLFDFRPPLLDTDGDGHDEAVVLAPLFNKRGVLTGRVVDATDRRLTAERGMASVVVVGVEEVGEGFRAFSVAGIRAHVRPFVEQGAIQALDFAVRLRAIGARALMDDAGGAESLGEQPGSVAGTVVGEDTLDGDAVL